jgi:hypothetical protein
MIRTGFSKGLWETPSEELSRESRKLSLKEFSKRLWKNGGKPVLVTIGLDRWS